MLKCSEIFKRNTFKSYSEFYLACAMAQECLRIGETLDISDMQIEKDILPSNFLEYFKVLVWEGAFTGVGEAHNGKKPEMSTNNKLYFNTECFDILGNTIYKSEGESLFWSFEYARDEYKGYRVNLSEADNFIMHIVANYLVQYYLGKITAKPLVISITDLQKVKTPYYYINLLSCCKTLPFLDGLVFMDIDFSEYNLDIEYSLFCNNGYAAKRNQKWSISEKKNFMKQEGIIEEGIYVLWERKGMNDSNPIGHIENCTLVRLDEIGAEDVSLTCIPLVKTQEEITDDYYEVPAEKRELFSDLLDFKVNSYLRSVSLYSMGVRNYMSDEDVFIDLIDVDEQVTKKITIDGKVDNVEMSGVDALYWLLCQFGVEFNKELYKSMYSPNQNLLWDIYGGDI